MSRRLSIARKQYTPRDRLDKDRFNIRLNVEAEVASNSYLFTGAFTREVKVYDIISRVENNIQKYLRGEINEDTVINMIYNQYTGVEIKPSREMPKYLGKIIIPGSSIKGIIRSRIEYKCSSSISCYSVESRELPPKQFYWRHVKYWGNNIVDARGTCSPDNVCIVCDLFGAPGILSRVYFTDMIMSSGRVSFLRDLGIEAVNPNSKFNLEVNGVNFNFLDLGLILAGFEIFTGSFVPICAYKYRYNPKLGGEYYIGKYVFGLVKFSINGFREIISKKLSDLTLKDLISRSREELVNTLRDNIDISRGVI